MFIESIMFDICTYCVFILYSRDAANVADDDGGGIDDNDDYDGVDDSDDGCRDSSGDDDASRRKMKLRKWAIIFKASSEENKLCFHVIHWVEFT